MVALSFLILMTLQFRRSILISKIQLQLLGLTANKESSQQVVRMALFVFTIHFLGKIIY